MATKNPSQLMLKNLCPGAYNIRMKHHTVKRILVVAMPLIGDVLLATPLLRSLRQRFPEAIIEVLVYKGHETILEGNPDVNHAISVTERPGFGELAGLIRRIFRRYDLSFSNSTSDRKILYALLAGHKSVSIVPPARWQDAWKRIFNYAWTVLDDESTHTVIQNLRLADLVEVKRCYEVVAPESEIAVQRLSQLMPFPWQTEKYAVLHPTPRWNYKRWTINGWSALAQYLVKKGLHIVLTGGGGQQETKYIQTTTLSMPKGVVNLAGRLRFSEVAKLIASSSIYIGPDTAVTHIAAATGAPTVALFGPTNPLKWAPWPKKYATDKSPFEKVGTQRLNNVLLIQGVGDCVPCHEEGCDRHKLSSSRCLEELSSTTVIRAIDTFIDVGKTPLSSDDRG